MSDEYELQKSLGICDNCILQMKKELAIVEGQRLEIILKMLKLKHEQLKLKETELQTIRRG